MAFLTEARARAAASTESRVTAQMALREFKNKPDTETFDVFLSHSYSDARIVLGVKELLEAADLRVYVDWIDDKQLDREKVTAATADHLRMRMRHSNSLIYATSETSSRSKWMPWELGYFDGMKPGQVAILPIVETEEDDYRGQEYLGLYPYLEDVRELTGRHSLVLRRGRRAVGVQEFAMRGPA